MNALGKTNQDTTFLDGRDAEHGAVVHFNGKDLIISKDQFIQVVVPAVNGYYQIGDLSYNDLFKTFPVLLNHKMPAYYIEAAHVTIVDGQTPVTPPTKVVKKYLITVEEVE